MVKLALCAFALGAWCLQQCASLPSFAACCALTVAAGLTLAATGAGRLHAKLALLTPLAVLALGLAGGFDWAAWRAAQYLQTSLPLALEQRDLTVEGVVRGLPEPQAYGTRFVFQVSRYETAGDAALSSLAGPAARFGATQLPAALPRTVLLTWYASQTAHPASAAAASAGPPQLLPGQRWRLTVRLRRPHGNANEFGFDHERWMLERDLRATGAVRPGPPPQWLGERRDWSPAALVDAIDRLRARLRQRIETVLAGAPHAGVIVALATGAQSAISQQDWQRFTQTGTNHLVAISGLHVSMVAGLAAWLAGWAWRNAARIGWPLPLLRPAQHIAALAGVLAGGAYIALAGFGVPAQRAWWMLVAAAAAILSGRDTGVTSVLAWALGLVVLTDPWAVAAPGLALSFGAVGTVLLAAAGQRRRRQPHAATGVGGWPARIWQHLKSALQLHGVVTVALVPLSVAWFAQVPLVGVPANLLAIPWVSLLVTPLVLLGVLLPIPLDGWAYQGAQQLVGWLAAYFDLLRLPAWALWRVPSPGPLAFLLALGGIGWWLMPRGWPLRHYGLLLLAPLLWPYRATPALGEFRATVLDVGQGGSTLIETATHQLLFDAGPGPESTDAGQRVVLPFLQTHGIETLDLLMISHGDSDHAGGAAAVLDGFKVASLRASVPPAHRLWQQAQAAGVVDRDLCRAGSHWTWDAVQFEVLWPATAPDPAAPNQTACVLRVSNRAHAILLSADIEAAAEQALIARVAALEPGRLAAEVLLAPHHGSKTSSTTAFLAAIMPREVVFQVGYRNRFHHPHPSVVARYRALGATLFRSDADGEVRFETDQAVLDAARYRSWHRRYWMGR